MWWGPGGRCLADLLSGAGKGAQEGNKPGSGRVPKRGPAGSTSCRGARGALQEGIGNLVVDVLLLEDVLVREGSLPVEVLKPCSSAEAEELVVDEAILDVVELVDVLHNCLTLILDKMLDKIINADGNPEANVAVNHQGISREQGAEVLKGRSALTMR